MAVAALKCTECGSSEVTEFKPGSFVCSHCETVFRDDGTLQIAVQRCSCGAYAAGACAECDSPICTEWGCGHRVGNRLLCYQHAAEAEARVNEAKAQEVAEARERHATFRQDAEDKFLRAMKQNGNPGSQEFPIVDKHGAKLGAVRAWRIYTSIEGGYISDFGGESGSPIHWYFGVDRKFYKGTNYERRTWRGSKWIDALLRGNDPEAVAGAPRWWPNTHDPKFAFTPKFDVATEMQRLTRALLGRDLFGDVRTPTEQ